MREIKFRGWYGSKLGMMMPTFNGNINEIFAQKHGDYMQFTGLRDKNDNEIYEKDIYQTPYMEKRGCAYKVIYSTEFAGYLFCPFKIGDENAPLLGIEEFAQEWETVGSNGRVIGNIYENPEMISGSLAQSEDVRY